MFRTVEDCNGKKLRVGSRVIPNCGGVLLLKAEGIIKKISFKEGKGWINVYNSKEKTLYKGLSPTLFKKEESKIINCLSKLSKKIVYYTKPYRIYYRIYYYLFATRTISYPKQVRSPIPVICRLQIHPKYKKHHNFVYAEVKPKKWLYWRRKFAFRTFGCESWFMLPRLTPWEYNEKTGETKFGLNYTFVKRYKDLLEGMEVITWI
jgi:hypothetical protein